MDRALEKASYWTTLHGRGSICICRQMRAGHARSRTQAAEILADVERNRGDRSIGRFLLRASG